MAKILDQPGHYPVQPEIINSEEQEWPHFDTVAKQRTARTIVLFCQARDQGWKPFFPEEIEAFCVSNSSGQNLGLGELIIPDFLYTPGANLPANQGYIAKAADGSLHLSDEFILRCYQSAPGVNNL
jgi:hypothetical protein